VHKLRMSGAPRWSNCAASASMEYDEPNTSNDAAREGTAAHWVLETGASVAGEKAPNGIIIDEDMIIHAQEVIEHFRTLEGCEELEMEAVVQVSTPAGHTITGRCDLRVRTFNHLIIADYKYGRGLVDDWSQTLGYAVATLAGERLPNNIDLMILQPRPWHHDGPYRTKTLSRAEFETTRDQFLDAADATYLPDPEMVVGRYCKECKAGHKCPALRMSSLEAIDKYTGLSILPDMPANELSAEYDQVTRLLSVVSKRKDVLSDQIKLKLNSGQYVPNYQTLPKFGNRFWQDENQAKLMAALTGVDISTQSILTPTQAVKKGLADELVSTLTSRSISSHQLVRVDVSKKAKEVFKNE